MADFEVGFPDGQYIAFGIDPDTALQLAEAFHIGADPQPIISSISDPKKREVAQRITNKLADHSSRGKGK